MDDIYRYISYVEETCGAWTSDDSSTNSEAENMNDIPDDKLFTMDSTGLQKV
jgi:hypothetical protein